MVRKGGPADAPHVVGGLGQVFETLDLLFVGHGNDIVALVVHHPAPRVKVQGSGVGLG